MILTKFGINKDECEFCEGVVNAIDIKNRRLNTSYVNDENNFFTSCTPCYKRAYEMYEEMWDEYYRGLL